jgi:hypothetical protein
MAEANEDDFEIEDDGPEIEIEDDTPPEDRDRPRMPQEIVDELEADELEDYSDKVKTRLKQLKKVYHDERREKEQAIREQREAVAAAQRFYQENTRLRSTLSQGEQSLVSSYTQTVNMEQEAARRAYKEAYETGDSDKLIEAQEQLTAANYRLEQLRNYRPTLQTEPEQVQPQQVADQQPRLDPKTVAWQERNTWWGTNTEMTAAALGLHQKLQQQNGEQYVGSDEYWRTIDTTMKRRFPEYYGDETSGDKPSRSGVKPSIVVAPASRSTSSRKIVLKQSQVALAKKLGLTNEQYAREMMKLEKNNG